MATVTFGRPVLRGAERCGGPLVQVGADTEDRGDPL